MKRLALLLGVVFVIAACAPREAVDRWIPTSGFTQILGPVPCDQYPYACGSPGLADYAHKLVYLDPVVIAKEQGWQDQVDPSLNVFEHVYYHEWSHVIDLMVGFTEGATVDGFEHAAQCGMQLILNRSWIPPGGTPERYWICPESEVEHTREVWTAKGIIS